MKKYILIKKKIFYSILTTIPSFKSFLGSIHRVFSKKLFQNFKSLTSLFIYKLNTHRAIVINNKLVQTLRKVSTQLCLSSLSEMYSSKILKLRRESVLKDLVIKLNNNNQKFAHIFSWKREIKDFFLSKKLKSYIDENIIKPAYLDFWQNIKSYLDHKQSLLNESLRQTKISSQEIKINILGNNRSPLKNQVKVTDLLSHSVMSNIREEYSSYNMELDNEEAMQDRLFEAVLKIQNKWREHTNNQKLLRYSLKLKKLSRVTKIMLNLFKHPYEKWAILSGVKVEKKD